MANKLIRDKLKYAENFSHKSRFMKQKHDKRVVSKYYKRNRLTYGLKCKRKTKSKDEKMIKTRNGRLALSSNCVACGSKRSR